MSQTLAVSVSSTQTMTRAEITVSAASTSTTGNALGVTTASELVEIINDRSAQWPIEYRVGSGAWQSVGENKTATVVIDLSTTTLAFRRSSNAPTLVVDLRIYSKPEGFSAGQQGDVAIFTAAEQTGLKALVARDWISGNASTALAKWRKARAKMQAGVSNAKVLAIGDSSEVGSGSTGVTGYVAGGRTTSPPVLLASMLTARGLPAQAEGSTFGNPTNGNASVFLAWDPRWTVDQWWTQVTSVTAGIGLKQARADVSGYQTKFRPTGNVTTFVVWYATLSTARNFTWAIDGGSTTVVQTGTGTVGVASVVIPAGTSGSHELTITSGTSLPQFIFAVQAYDSGTKTVEVLSSGVAGARISQFASAAAGYDYLNILGAFAPDFVQINACINEWGGSYDIPQFKTNLATVITKAKLSASVLVKTGVPSDITYVAASPGGKSLAFQQTYVDAAIEVALANDCMVLDTWRMFGSREGDTSIYTDELHPNQAGYRFRDWPVAELLTM